ncbi:MAG: PHB depolymerase family esterase [Eubacteriales bacterium]|nr:PHB depolymerase family esterase [Eubacteriales bacterium]
MKSYLQEPVAKKLPDASEASIDRRHYYRQFLHGYYQFDCVVEKGVTRSTKFYIPEGSVYNQPTIFIGVPGGNNTWEFMVNSGWKALSDQYGLYLVLMEAADETGWKGDAADLAYLNALNNDISLRPMFCSFQPNFYAAAYGDAADVIGVQSRRNPRAYAAAALIGTNGMSAEEATVLKETETKVPGVSLAEVQCPVWLSFAEHTEAVDREIEYYKTADHSSSETICKGTKTVWLPAEGGDADEYWCAKVVTDTIPYEKCLNKNYGEQILTELFDGIYRYPGNNNGALRKAGNIFERGFERYSADVWGGYYADKRDTYRREWYVYQPQKTVSENNVPAVFVFHGAGGSGDEIADRIGWSYVADKYGLIIIMPTASEPNEVRNISDISTNNIFRPMWNTGYPQPERPEDMRFIDYLHQWLIENYPVDPSRIYASGQSSGGMMSWACAAYRPDLFAASAPFSARDIDIEAKERGEAEKPPVKGSPVPIIANLGTCDAAFKGGFSQAEELINLWCDHYALTKKWEDYSYTDGGKNCSRKEGKLAHYIFETKAGVPLLYLTETDTKAHATWPSECEFVWTEFLSHFAKDPETKQLFYNGKACE